MPTGRFADRILDAFLTKPQDRALFNLAPRPDSDSGG